MGPPPVTTGRTARAVTLKMVADVAARGAGLVTFPIVARAFGADGYGALTQLFLVVGFLAPVASFGLGNAMTRFVSGVVWTTQLRGAVKRAVVLVLFAGTLVTVLVAWRAESINDWILNWENGRELFRWGAPLVLVSALELPLLDLMRARDRLIAYSTYHLAQAGVGVVAATLAVLVGGSIVLLVQLALLGRAGLLLLAGAVALGSPAVDVPSTDRPSVRSMVGFGTPLIIVGLGLWLVNLGDRLVIGNVLGAPAVGRYGAVYTVAGLQMLGSAALFLPAYPRIVATLKRGSEELASEVRLFHRHLVLVLVPSATFLVVATSPLLVLLGGSGFDVSPWVVILLVVGLFVGQWNGLAHYVLMSRDRTRALQTTWLGAGVANVGLNLVLVPQFGLAGAAAATLVTFAAMEIAVYLMARAHVDLARYYSWVPTAQSLSLSAVAALAAAACFRTIDLPLVAVPTGAIAFGCVYLVGMRLSGALSSDDVDTALGVLPAALRDRLRRSEGPGV